MGSSPARCLAQSACSPSAGPLRWSWPRRERKGPKSREFAKPFSETEREAQSEGQGCLAHETGTLRAASLALPGWSKRVLETLSGG